jgi:hypothetical protein
MDQAGSATLCLSKHNEINSTISAAYCGFLSPML